MVARAAKVESGWLVGQKNLNPAATGRGGGNTEYRTGYCSSQRPALRHGVRIKRCQCRLNLRSLIETDRVEPSYQRLVACCCESRPSVALTDSAARWSTAASANASGSRICYSHWHRSGISSLSTFQPLNRPQNLCHGTSTRGLNGRIAYLTPPLRQRSLDR